MKNLQSVINRHMESAQTVWADDKEMQEAVDAFAIMSDITKGKIAEAVKRFTGLDTAPMEDIAVALELDKGREWTEETFGIRFA